MEHDMKIGIISKCDTLIMKSHFMRYLINDQLYPYEIKFGHSGVAYIGISSLMIFYLYGIYE